MKSDEICFCIHIDVFLLILMHFIIPLKYFFANLDVDV